MDDREQIISANVTPELYFLIAKFLADGPLRNASEVLMQELDRLKVFPRRIDWTGEEHEQTFAELERQFSHIGPLHLLEICKRVPALLDKELVPSVNGVTSLLGAGRQSLLRTKETITAPKGIVAHCSRIHGMPVLESINKKPVNNIVQVLYGRESSGPITRKLAVPTKFYGKLDLLRRSLGHLSAVYCVLFDRSGKYIITGADDLLVKLWSAIDGRLLATFRGASAEITDIAVNLDNTLLAAGSLDRILRVWDMQTGGPIAVLSAHTGMITSVNFCPSRNRELKYLVTTSTDGSVAFWQYYTPRGAKSSFASKPIQFLEKIRPGQAQMICASFSPGGKFLAAGSADHHVRVYLMGEEGPKRILEIEAHTDTVDSIQWAHQGLKFVSGGKDGIAYMWTFESQQWKSMKLSMTERLPGENVSEDDARKLKVTMVSWDASDKWVITAVNDFSIKVWNSATGKLHKVMTGHTDELFVLESHPIDPHVLVSAGHDGQLFIWDIMEGQSIAHFVNHIDGQGNGGIFDAKWSPDGSMIAATDSHGHILMYGFGSGHPRLKMLPKELFFHTDYRPLIRDVNHYVMDEQTQTTPHLMPPPFLVDVDGNPHPPSFQRLVPGRENCTTEQLVPNITIGPEGVEVVESPNTVSNIDRLIAALANRQGPGQAPDSNNERDQQANRPSNSPRANGRVGSVRRSGDVEGVRQSSGNWQRDVNLKWIRRIYVQPMRYSRLQTLRQKVYHAGLLEQDIYRREMRRRPMMINTSITSSSSLRSANKNRNSGRGRRPGASVTPAYRTRAVREREDMDDDDPDVIASASSDSDNTSDATAAEDLSGSSSSSDTESSDYSDWVGTDQALEPPKRSKRKSVQNRSHSPTNSDMNQNTERTVGRKKVVIPEGEIPESYRPPEWLSEVIPKKTPYYPQMGDEVVYFRQGHQRYLDAVRSKKVYKLSNNVEPWVQFDLRDNEVVKVIGIKYEIRPPRLCCLKLALLNSDGSFTGQSFSIKYHDMPDVLDFIVLRQTYDTAVQRLWTTGERFRCMIDDGWWMGVIESRTPLSPDFPHSLFMCFRIRWDNGEYEFMSPWDMEPIDNNRIPTEVGGAVPVLPEELRATLYQPRSEEWPRGDRDATCRRIISGLEEVMGLAIADPFLAPVDLNIYPTYAYVIEYPIDLTTIKARFDNHFYRRLTAAQFDVRYLATNAERFNQSGSHIIKHARIITDLCLRIIKDQNIVDVGAVYHQLMDTYVTTDTDGDNEAGPSMRNASSSGARRSTRLRRAPEVDWRVKCRDVLDAIWQSNDSEPFREPVDLIEHPDYLTSIDTPMDLRTVKEELLGGNYKSATDFVKDMRLIFTNSRNYNTNKRSRIYSMTLRLSGLFEDKLEQLFYNWKSTKRRPAKKKPSPSQSHQHRPGPTTRRSTATHANGSVEEESDDDDDDDDDLPLRNGRASRRNIQHTTSNGVSSSVNTEPVAGPSTSRGHTRKSRADSVDQLRETSSNSSSSSSDSDGSDNDSDDEPSIPVSALGTHRVRRRNSDSEASYKPNRRITKPKRRKKRKGDKKDKRKKSNGGVGRPGRPPKQRIIHSDEDYAVNNRNSESPKKLPGRPKRSRRARESSSSSDGELKRRKQRKRRGYNSGSDNSCTLNNSQPVERNPLETDSDGQVVRSTRGRKKKTWPREADSQDDQDHNQRHRATQSSQTVQRRYPQRKLLTDSDNSPDEQTSSRRTNTFRRDTRSRASQEESDDDQTLSQVIMNSSFRSRSRRSFVTEPATNGISSRIVTRQQMPTSSQRSVTTTHEVIPVRLQRSSVQEDHNYDEPGPSSRYTRRNNVTLSRHQRNADELDCPTTQRTEMHRIIPAQSSISGRLRQRMVPAVTSTLPSSSSRTPRTVRLPERINEDDDANDDDESDPEDDKPLSQTRTASGLPMRNRSFCDDEYLPGQPSTSKSSRSTRALKRQYYNEDTDEETQNGNNPSAKRRLQTSSETPLRASQSNNATATTTTSQFESDNSEDELPLSVSSRGRIRKINPKARGLFRE